MLEEVRNLYHNQGITESTKIDFGKKDVKGDKDVDQNEDGLNNFKDVMISRMIKSGMTRKEAEEYVENKYQTKSNIKVEEDFSNWRSDLREVLDDLQTDIENSQVKLKKGLNNYKNKAINLNPTLGQVAEGLGGEIIGEYELTEEYIEEAIEIAAQYFCEQGLNEDGIDIVIEEVGIDNFLEFVFNLTEDYILNEARTLIGKKKSPATGKERGVSLKAAPGKTTKAALEKHGSVRALSGNSPSGTIKKTVRQKINKDNVETAVKSAVESQPKKKQNTPAILDKLAFTINHGLERHNQATTKASNTVKQAGSLARQTGDTVGKAVSGVGKAWQGVSDSKLGQVTRIGYKKALKKVGDDIKTTGAALGRGVGTTVAANKKGETKTSAIGKGIRAGIGRLFGEDFEMWVDSLISEGYDLSEYSLVELHESYLEEKAVSEQQQKLFGLALSYKRGKVSKEEVSPEVIKLANSMSEKELIKYASTSHKDVPERV